MVSTVYNNNTWEFPRVESWIKLKFCLFISVGVVQLDFIGWIWTVRFGPHAFVHIEVFFLLFVLLIVIIIMGLATVIEV